MAELFEVTLSVLQQKSGEICKQAAAGATIFVTDHGKRVAKIVALGPSDKPGAYKFNPKCRCPLCNEHRAMLSAAPSAPTGERAAGLTDEERKTLQTAVGNLNRPAPELADKVQVIIDRLTAKPTTTDQSREG